MPPLVVAKRLDVPEHPLGCLVRIPEGHLVGQVPFERCPKRFHWSIIITVASSTHALPKPAQAQSLSEVVGVVLAATVCMEDGLLLSNRQLEVLPCLANLGQCNH